MAQREPGVQHERQRERRPRQRRDRPHGVDGLGGHLPLRRRPPRRVPTSPQMTPAEYCEAMLYDYEPEWRPSGNIELDRPDVLAWKRPGWPVGYSRVAYAKWTAANADHRIGVLLAFCGDTPIFWYVGPSSAPADLAARLASHGLAL